MYKVMTSTVCDVPLMGHIASPSDYPITINGGWNWIGYPSNQSASLNEAMAGFEAEDDDIIKSRNNGYATYFGGTWVGTLNSLVPGSGYMYQSHSGTAKTLVFQQGRGQAAVNEQFDCTGSLSGIRTGPDCPEYKPYGVCIPAGPASGIYRPRLFLRNQNPVYRCRPSVSSSFPHRYAR